MCVRESKRRREKTARKEAHEEDAQREEREVASVMREPQANEQSAHDVSQAGWTPFSHETHDRIAEQACATASGRRERERSGSRDMHATWSKGGERRVTSRLSTPGKKGPKDGSDESRKEAQEGSQVAGCTGGG